MNVSWLPIIPYSTEGFTGFKCSNFLSLGRLLKAHSLILSKIKVKDSYKFPETDYKNWNAVNNRKWLHQNGYTTNGNAKTVRERVSKYMVLHSDGNANRQINSLSIDDVVRMMVSVYNSLCYLTHGSIDEHHSSMTLLSVIRSLNDIEYVDSHLRLPSSRPIWHIKYNLLCLLNCPKDMIRFGPITDRWEGSMEGEKCIQNVKKNFCGFRTGYLKVLHENFNIDQTLHNIERLSNLSNDNFSRQQNKNDWYTYRHTSTFVSALMLHRPIICYQVSINDTNKTKYGFLSQSLNIYLLENLKYMGIDKLCHVFDINVNNQADDLVIIGKENYQIGGYLLGIPIKQNKENHNISMSLYTFMSKNGMELYPDLTLKLPVM